MIMMMMMVMRTDFFVNSIFYIRFVLMRVCVNNSEFFVRSENTILSYGKKTKTKTKLFANLRRKWKIQTNKITDHHKKKKLEQESKKKKSENPNGIQYIWTNVFTLCLCVCVFITFFSLSLFLPLFLKLLLN